MSYIRTQEILESQMEMLYGRLCKVGEIPLLDGGVVAYTKAIQETAKTLLEYYTLETEPMPAYIAEGVRELDAADAAMMETQAADRLHDDLVELGKRLDTIANTMKCVREVHVAPYLGQGRRD